MANIEDYLEWRGDLTFNQAPFNEVDNLILSALSYIVFDGIVPGPAYKDVITLEEASKLFFKMYTAQDLAVQNTFTRLVPFILKKVAYTERFKHVGLCKYVSTIDYKDEKQFAALHILLEDGSTYISYRGTDDTLVGWKEDLNMTYMMPVPSQIEALRYLEETTRKSKRPLRIGGHSKGGNLAIYAAINCGDKLKKRIIEIYNNDGPGFYEDVIESKGYKEMLHKIKTIIPESSIIGMLLEHGDSYEVVKSTGKGIMQHDGLSWQVYRNGFVKLDERSKESLVIDKTISAWVMGLSDDERVAFVDAVYDMLTRAGVNYLSDLEKYKPATLNSMAKEMFSMEPEKGRMVRRTIRALISEYGQTVVKGMRGIN